MLLQNPAKVGYLGDKGLDAIRALSTLDRKVAQEVFALFSSI
jgi:hypothetical protein